MAASLLVLPMHHVMQTGDGSCTACARTHPQGQKLDQRRLLAAPWPVVPHAGGGSGAPCLRQTCRATGWPRAAAVACMHACMPAHKCNVCCRAWAHKHISAALKFDIGVSWPCRCTGRSLAALSQCKLIVGQPTAMILHCPQCVAGTASPRSRPASTVVYLHTTSIAMYVLALLSRNSSSSTALMQG